MKKKAIVFNLLFLICELVGLGISLLTSHKLYLEYYTIDSNLFAFIIALIYLYYICKDKAISKILYIFRLMSLVCLMITLLVVVFILPFMTSIKFLFWGYYGINFILHLLCPLLLLYIYFKFDKKVVINKLELTYNMIPTLIYGFVLIALNIKGIVDGPYFFLRYKFQPFYQSVLWFLLIGGSTYPIGLLLHKLKKIGSVYEKE